MDSENLPAVDSDGFVRMCGEVIGRVKRRSDGWDAMIGGGCLGARGTRGQAVELLRVRANRGRYDDIAQDVRRLLVRVLRDADRRHVESMALQSIGMISAIGFCSIEPADALDLIYQAAEWAGVAPTFPRSACREVSRGA